MNIQRSEKLVGVFIKAYGSKYKRLEHFFRSKKESSKDQKIKI